MGKSRNLFFIFIPESVARVWLHPIRHFSLSQDEDDEPLLRVRRPHGGLRLRRRGGGGEEFVRRATIWK